MTTVEAICIGDELLDGRIADANVRALGDFLASRGHTLRAARFVGDDVADIVDALRSATASVVVVSGGLGPTSDDRTREAAAQFADTDLVENEALRLALEARLAGRGYPVTPNNLRQVAIPATASALATTVGTAPGFRLEPDHRTYYFLPGVTREFAWFLAEYIEPLFASRPDHARSRLLFHGLSESALETEIADVVAQAEARGVQVGYRASYPVIEVKLAGPRDPVAAAREEILGRIDVWFVGEDDETLAMRVGRRLLERGETVATAESCTAGGIAALITDVGGSSAWFGRGWVTYANEAKVDEVGVLESTLLRHGAVSAETVCQMAAGARTRARASYGLAVSGIAGPGGGTAEKPVGTVHFGLATAEGTFHRHVHYRVDGRARVRAGTAFTALAMLLNYLDRGAAALGAPIDDATVWRDA